LGYVEVLEGAVWCRVRVDGLVREHYVGDAVRVGGGIGVFLDDVRSDVGVGVHVEVGVARSSLEVVVAFQSEFDAHAGIAAVDGAEGVFCGDAELYRLVRHARECVRDGFDFCVGLVVEAVVEERYDDANSVEWYAEYLGELDSYGVRILRGGPDGEVVLLVLGGQCVVGFYGIVLHVRKRIGVFEDEVGFGCEAVVYVVGMGYGCYKVIFGDV